MTIEEIAKVCHQANKAYCESLGDTTQVNWEDTSDETKTSVIDGVKTRARHSMIAPAQMHNNWVRFKEGQGWKFGPTFDAEQKTHPCMLPFNQLPVEQQLKDRLFLAIAGALLKTY